MIAYTTPRGTTDHTLRMIGTCWWLGGLPAFEPLGLRQWAHMLGYGGHFSTKSRRYSTTLTALRRARAAPTGRRNSGRRSGSTTGPR